MCLIVTRGQRITWNERVTIVYSYLISRNSDARAFALGRVFRMPRR